MRIAILNLDSAHWTWKADDSEDGDFGSVVNLPLVVLTGTAIGAAAGWIVGGVAGAP